MKTSCKILPHINQLYIQRQESDSHKKKVQAIKHKKSKLSFDASKIQSSRNMPYNKSLVESRYKSQSRISSAQNYKSVQNDYPEIIEQVRSRMKHSWMSPYRKKIEIQKQKENQRLHRKILSSHSKIGADFLKRDYNRILSIKQRIRRFTVTEQSQKAILKSEKSLDNYYEKCLYRMNKYWSKKNSLASNNVRQQNKIRQQINNTSITRKNIDISSRNDINRSELIHKNFQFRKDHANRSWKQKNWLKNKPHLTSMKNKEEQKAILKKTSPYIDKQQDKKKQIVYPEQQIQKQKQSLSEIQEIVFRDQQQ